MRRTILVILLILTWAGGGSAAAAVQGQEVVYQAADTAMKGYLAYDGTRAEQRPGILVVHEWWGHNDYVRKRAQMLAELGYTALAVDMYGEGQQAAHPAEAQAFAGAVRANRELARKRFMAALDLLKEHHTVDPGRIAAIGYCFGGAVVLAMAREGIELKGVVSFHGSLATDQPAQPGAIKARVLVLNGEDDPMVTKEEIESFRQEMTAAGADYQLISYPGALHGFTNPEADALGRKFELPLAYDPAADRQSWQAMEDFFTEIFSSPAPN